MEGWVGSVVALGGGFPQFKPWLAALHIIALLRGLVTSRGNPSLPQGVILNVSEESPTRLYAVNALSLVGFEEIPRFTRDDNGYQQ